MDEIVVGDEDPEGGRLVFVGPSTAGHIGVRIESRFLRAADAMVLDASLPAFFAELSEAWRGWRGERLWQSAGESLTLAARHDGVGHVLIVATLREWALSGRETIERRGQWMATVAVGVEPAALGRIASALAGMVASDG